MRGKYKYKNRTINLEFELIERVKRQLQLLIMTEKIAQTKDGWKNIRYLRQKIARMGRGKKLRR